MTVPQVLGTDAVAIAVMAALLVPYARVWDENRRVFVTATAVAIALRSHAMALCGMALALFGLACTLGK